MWYVQISYGKLSKVITALYIILGVVVPPLIFGPLFFISFPFFFLSFEFFISKYTTRYTHQRDSTLFSSLLFFDARE